MNDRYVDVLIDIPHTSVDQLFTYKVPSAWNNLPLIGSRVIVPFGRRRAEAMVWRECENTDRHDIKDILEVLDEHPILTPSQMSLCDWIAQKYLSLRLDALHLFLPPGMSMSMEKRWTPKSDFNAIRKRVASLSIADETKNSLLNALEPICSKNSFITRGVYKELDDLFSLLASEDYLNTMWVPKNSRIRPKTQHIIRLSENSTTRLTSQQQKIVDFLRNNPDLHLTTRGLSDHTGVSEGVIRRLVSLGILFYESINISRISNKNDFQPTAPLPLTAEQATAFNKVCPGIASGEFQSFLLFGVTGSGKTEVYLRLLEEVIRQGKQGIFLVPEIALTPQTMARVRQRLGDRAAILHSRLSDGERYDQWWRIFRGEVDVVVGARSALFAPLKKIGLIILDEEHEFSYKQEESPRYQTRDVAREICRRTNATLILGSATPSLESWLKVEEDLLTKLEMTKRVGNRTLPSIETVDMRLELKEKHFGVLSRRLREAIEETLNRHEQVLLLLNRRGFSTFVMCRECGHVMSCPDCDVSLTFHQKPPQLKCHYCGFFSKPPDICPHCKSRYIKFFGQGTQRLEDEVLHLYPNASVARMDLDTTSRKGAHERIYRDLVERRTDILIGTQMIAKGLDLPGVTLVGVIAADATLNLPDFRASERTFQLLTQVAGRAGRGDNPGKVIIQTYNVDHYCIQSVVSADIQGFYSEELAIRQANAYPPFTHMIRAGFTGSDGSHVIQSAKAFVASIENENKDWNDEIDLLGPVPATIERIKGRTRWQVILKGKDPEQLRTIARQATARTSMMIGRNDTRIILDVDPYSLF
jgi:primosomal protein N' (replication factor Y)